MALPTARQAATRRLAGGAVRRVARGSLAERVGLRPGDRLLAVDGHPLRDAIDFRFYAAEDRFRLALRRDGHDTQIEIERRSGEDLGVEFESSVFDRVRTCNNDCFFCFLKGLPAGLRSSLYVKDDDFRLSFSQGNFVTLTNLTTADWQRLKEQRLSPLNVSVHATAPDLRPRMFRNRRAPDVITQLQRLGDLGIRVDTQVVLCPGLNDGHHLAQTVHDLAALYPAVQSIGIVPVAASRHAWRRSSEDDRAWLAPITPESARRVIAQVRPWQRDFRRSLGVDLAYLADEFYIVAGARLPPSTRYDRYPQYENGIGMTRALIEDWRRLRRRIPALDVSSLAPKRLTLACGVLVAPTLSAMALEFASLTGTDVHVAPVENRLFGPRVTVSGLLAGADIVASLRDRDLGELVVLPRNALDHAGALFLDDATPDDVSAALATPVAFASTLSDLLRLLRV
jgi:putative radical SAM enzyme (TIGR03279 family)